MSIYFKLSFVPEPTFLAPEVPRRAMGLVVSDVTVLACGNVVTFQTVISGLSLKPFLVVSIPLVSFLMILFGVLPHCSAVNANIVA